MAMYKCDEIDCIISRGYLDEPAGRIIIDGKEIDICADVLNGGKFKVDTVKSYEDDSLNDRKKLFKGDFNGDIDTFTVKLDEKSMKKLSKLNLKSNILTFREIKNDSGKEIVKNAILSNSKIKKKYAQIDSIDFIYCTYDAVYKNGRFIEKKIWECKINDKDTYTIYTYRYNIYGNWIIKGILKENMSYISDDGKVRVIYRGEEESKKVIAQLDKKYSDMYEEIGSFDFVGLCTLYLHFKYPSEINSVEFDIPRMDVDEFDAVLTEESKKEYGQYFDKLHFHEMD